MGSQLAGVVKNDVNDCCIKVGGFQRITTLEGYVIPLNIVQGLPWVTIHPTLTRNGITSLMWPYQWIRLGPGQLDLNLEDDTIGMIQSVTYCRPLLFFAWQVQWLLAVGNSVNSKHWLCMTLLTAVFIQPLPMAHSFMKPSHHNSFLNSQFWIVTKTLPDTYYSTKTYKLSMCKPLNFTIDHGGFGGWW